MGTFDRSAYPSVIQKDDFGYVDWSRMETVIIEGAGSRRHYEKRTVPAGCYSCGNERLLKLSEASRRKSYLCESCSRHRVLSGRSDRDLFAVQRRGQEVMPTGAVIHWDRAFYNSAESGRRFTFVPYTCPCGESLQTKLGLVKDAGFTGLCRKCSACFPTWKKHKISPSRYLSNCYYMKSVAKDEIGAGMANFKSESPFSIAYVAEHRLVVAQSIGRDLKTGEHVHHIDADKLNNNIENLLLVDAREHNAITRMETFYEAKIKLLEDEIAALQARL
jgi:hypothetical protein